MTLLGMFLDPVQNITETWFYKSNFKLFEVIKEFKHNNQEFKLTRITGQISFSKYKGCTCIYKQEEKIHQA